MLDIPEPSPSLMKNASDWGDHENIAGGSTRRPFKTMVFPLMEIRPLEANLSTKRLFGEGNSAAQSAMSSRTDSFHAGAPEYLQPCAKLAEQNAAQIANTSS